MIQQTLVTIITGFLEAGGEPSNGCICCLIADKFNAPPLYALPPPLAPPRKGEGNTAQKLNLLPSPLRGGIEGGGIGIKEGGVCVLRFNRRTMRAWSGGKYHAYIKRHIS